MRTWWISLIPAAGIVLLFSLTSGPFLVVDQPQRADVILVLAGETEQRPARGLELLRQNVAPRMIIDVPAAAKIYGFAQVQLADDYIRQLPQANSISTCPVHGLSTKAEVDDVRRCLAGENVRSVLIVTSDYHTRRALSTFRTALPAYTYCVTAAREPSEFGVRWWRKREWAKVNFDEWLRLMWWECVDRWH